MMTITSKAHTAVLLTPRSLLYPTHTPPASLWRCPPPTSSARCVRSWPACYLCSSTSHLHPDSAVRGARQGQARQQNRAPTAPGRRTTLLLAIPAKPSYSQPLCPHHSSLLWHFCPSRLSHVQQWICCRGGTFVCVTTRTHTLLHARALIPHHHSSRACRHT